MGKFLLGASVMSWLDVVKSSASVDYDAKLDGRFKNGNYERSAENAGDAIEVSLSIGDGGRGSAKLVLPGDTISDVVEVLENWDPEVVNPENLTPAQIVKRTLRAEYADLPVDAPEGTKPELSAVVFRTSLAKHTREIRIPAEHFPGFIAFLGETFDTDTIERAVVHYRGEVAKAEAAEKARQEKKASQQSPAQAK